MLSFRFKTLPSVALVATAGALLGQMLRPGCASACSCAEIDSRGKWELSPSSVETLQGDEDHSSNWDEPFILMYEDEWRLHATQTGSISFRSSCR